MFRRDLKDYVLVEDFDQFKSFFSKFSSDIQRPISKIDPLEMEVDALKLKLNDFDGLKNLIESLKEQISVLELDTVRKTTDLEEKIGNLSTKLEELSQRPVETQPRTPMLDPNRDFSKESFEKDLSRKVNMEDYLAVTREIDLIKDSVSLLSMQVSQLAENQSDVKHALQPPPQQQGNNVKELNILKDLSAKCSDLESLLRKVQREHADFAAVSNAKHKDLFEQLKGLEDKKLDRSEIKIDRIEELLKKVSILENESRGLKEQQFAMEKTVGMHEGSLADLMKELAKLRKKNSVGEVPSVNKEMVNKFIDEALRNLKKEIEVFWAQISLTVNKKSGMDDLWKLEGNILLGVGH